MSTYTKYIENGIITNGADFLKLCIRNFGIASDLKDEPLSVPVPTHFEVHPYYKMAYQKAVEENNKVQRITFEEAKQEISEKCEERVRVYKEFYNDCIENNKKYKKVKEEILNWIPPTFDHIKIKKFALEQIDNCIKTEIDLQKYECNIASAEARQHWTDEKIQEYLDRKKRDARDAVERTYQNWQEAIKDAEMKNLWMKQFLDSLETIGDESSVSERGN